MPVTPTKNKKCFNANGTPKIRFATREAAVAYRNDKISSGVRAPGSIGAYPCEFCGTYHVGSRRIDASSRGGLRGGNRSGGRRQGHHR